MNYVDMITSDAHYLVHSKGERRKTLKFLNANYPPNSVIGINKTDGTVLEVWLLEWNYVKGPDNNSYIIGGRAAGVADSECYIIKPVKTGATGRIIRWSLS